MNDYHFNVSWTDAYDAEDVACYTVALYQGGNGMPVQFYVVDDVDPALTTWEAVKPALDTLTADYCVPEGTEIVWNV